MSKEEGQERRGFFRIDDQVALSYRLVPDKEVISNDGALQVKENDPLSLSNELEKMREVSRIHLRHVEKQSPEVARYFVHLESKIDLLVHHVMTGSDALFVKKTQSVSISGSGIAFTATEGLAVGDFVEIRFILKPSLTTIQTFAKVVSSIPESTGFKIAVEYTHLNDGDRDLLIRHVVKKQMNDIREERE
jgi:hypothetical protein